MYVFSIALVIGANLLYHVCQKSTPGDVNPFASLIVTYIVAAILTFLASFFFAGERTVFRSFLELNWTSYVLGIAILGLEFGYLLAYRAGWNISIGSLVANTSVALLLIPVGILAYREGFSPVKIFGVALSLTGLVLVNL